MTAQVELPWGEPAAAQRLQHWTPEAWEVAADWRSSVRSFFASGAGLELATRLRSRLAQGAVVFPPQPLAALALTPKSQVRVVILGQDPYHGAGQAEGLAFSVAEGQKCPPSLRNIFKELDREVSACELPASLLGRAHGVSLRGWAAQGVLLLNACLTVEEGQPACHAGYGWEVLTASLVRQVAAAEQPVAFLLWGAHAQKFAATVDELGQRRHLVLKANHPSPLSAMRQPTPFLGCGHFAQVNAFLDRHGSAPIVW